MRFFLCAIAFGAVLLVGAASWAASVEPGQGELFVNQGQGYQRVDGRIEAKVGDSIMVSPDGAATLLYPDGCQVAVQPGAVTSIDPLSPCASGSFAQQQPWDWNDATPWIAGAGFAGAAGLGAYAATRPQAAPPGSPGAGNGVLTSTQTQPASPASP
jgi:hypothetical protein